MFTGIIEKTGKVQSITHSGGAARLIINSEGFWDDLKLGDSVAVDGVCLTVVTMNSKTAAFDVSAETIDRSIMGGYRPDVTVNLEKALLPTDRLGGHFVQGHVDGIGTYTGKSVVGKNVELSFELPDELSRYVVEKGSITINGVSLTAASIVGNRFTVAVIPHTLKITSLSELTTGSKVNLEADVIAKYVEKLLLSEDGRGIDREFLKKNGFI